MSTAFAHATADHMIDVVEAVILNRGEASIDFVSRFVGLNNDQAKNALSLSVNIGLLQESSGVYKLFSPLCKFLVTPNRENKVAILRILLQSYRPFTFFKGRLITTDDIKKAADDTIKFFDFNVSLENFKLTIISLGTYSGALIAEKGDRYNVKENPEDNPLQIIADACEDISAAKARIREQIGEEAVGVISENDVIEPLANSLIKAISGEPRDAVTNAGNAIDSFLTELSLRVGVTLSGTGINTKLDNLRGNWNLPTKLKNVGYYLGHIRNAADHGVDADIGAAWVIRENTGLEYVFVACSFIASVIAFEKGNFEI